MLGKAEEDAERRERYSDADWLYLIFIPWIMCPRVDAGTLLSTLNVGALIPAFPFCSLKVHHWIKFTVQPATELLPSSNVLLFSLTSYDLTTFLLQNLLGKLLGHRLLTQIHLQMPEPPQIIFAPAHPI